MGVILHQGQFACAGVHPKLTASKLLSLPLQFAVANLPSSSPLLVLYNRTGFTLVLRLHALLHLDIEAVHVNQSHNSLHLCNRTPLTCVILAWVVKAPSGHIQPV